MTSRQSDTGYGYTRLKPTAIGAGAAELVWDALAELRTDSKSVSCHIDAVFDRTVHLSLSVRAGSDSPSLLVLGTRDVREGPLMVNVATPPGFSFRRLFGDRDASATVQLLNRSESPDGLQFRLGQHGTLDVNTSAVPTLPAGGGTYERVPLGQFVAGGACSTTHVRLIDRLDTEGIEDGLDWFGKLVTYHSGRRAGEVEALAASVVDWIAEDPVCEESTPDRRAAKDRRRAGHPRGVPDGITDFIGRGPGATPSGDDFLAGLVLPLRLVDDAVVSRRAHDLSCRLATLAVDESTTVSAALLAQTTRGRAARPVVDCLETLLTANAGVEATYRDATGITTIGHTSGSDTLAGMLTATTVVCPLLATRR